MSGAFKTENNTRWEANPGLPNVHTSPVRGDWKSALVGIMYTCSLVSDARLSGLSFSSPYHII